MKENGYMKGSYQGKPYLAVQVDEGGHGYGIVPCDQIGAKPIWIRKEEFKEFIPESEKKQTFVLGVGKDSPTVTNEKGGKQSKVLYRYDLLDPLAMFEMTRVLAEGAEKYGDDNWRNITIKEHLNHMIVHAYAYLAGDKSDEHLSHIMCRAMFAQAVEKQEG